MHIRMMICWKYPIFPKKVTAWKLAVKLLTGMEQHVAPIETKPLYQDAVVHCLKRLNSNR
jgi:hypothetical protein